MIRPGHVLKVSFQSARKLEFWFESMSEALEIFENLYVAANDCDNPGFQMSLEPMSEQQADDPDWTALEKAGWKEGPDSVDR